MKPMLRSNHLGQRTRKGQWIECQVTPATKRETARPSLDAPAYRGEPLLSTCDADCARRSLRNANALRGIQRNRRLTESLWWIARMASANSGATLTVSILAHAAADTLSGTVSVTMTFDSTLSSMR